MLSSLSDVSGIHLPLSAFYMIATPSHPLLALTSPPSYRCTFLISFLDLSPCNHCEGLSNPKEIKLNYHQCPHPTLHCPKHVATIRMYISLQVPGDTADHPKGLLIPLSQSQVGTASHACCPQALCKLAALTCAPATTLTILFGQNDSLVSLPLSGHH